jgi:hypothetical protein
MIRPISQSWRSELDRTAFKRAMRAKEAGFGTDVVGFEAELLSKLNAWVRGAEIRRRMEETALTAVLDSGRFQPLAQTGTSSSGITNPDMRADDEYRIFGIEHGAPASERLIYCYLEGSDEAGALAQQYGAIVVGFHDRLRANATFVLGDTRDATLMTPVFAPVPLLDPSIDAFSNSKRGLLSAQTMAETCADDYGYAEVQIHAGLLASDITRVVYTRGTQPSEHALELLGRYGLKPHCAAGDDPGPRR